MGFDHLFHGFPHHLRYDLFRRFYEIEEVVTRTYAKTHLSTAFSLTYKQIFCFMVKICIYKVVVIIGYRSFEICAATGRHGA